MTEKGRFKSLKAGDSVLFEALYRNISPRLYSFVYSVIRNRADALDILQNVFLKIWDRRETIDFEDNFEAYIYTAARNMTYNFLRNKVYADVSCNGAADRAGAAPDPHAVMVQNEFSGMFGKVLDSLPEQRRRIFVMSRLDGMSYRQIAEKLSISENTVDTQIRRALKDFRQLLSKEELLVIAVFFQNLL